MKRKEYQQTSGLIAMILLIILLWIIAAGCGPAHYLKKAERALKKAEQLGADISHDTAWQTIEIYTPEITTDTVFTSIPGDTVRIEKDRLKIKYVNLPKDSVYIYGECESDTVKVEVPVKVYREIRAGMTTWETVILCIALLPIAWLLFSFVIIPLVRRARR